MITKVQYGEIREILYRYVDHCNQVEDATEFVEWPGSDYYTNKIAEILGVAVSEDLVTFVADDDGEKFSVPSQRLFNLIQPSEEVKTEAEEGRTEDPQRAE